MGKVLIVDDSALMRRHLMNILEAGGFELEFARNGQECLDKLETFAPDAITLDIEMPVMDGLTCLEKIMRTRPTPVVMVSSLTQKGAETTFKALELGAIDYVSKPNGSVSLNMDSSSDILIAKVKSAVNTRKGPGLAIKQSIRLRQEKSYQPTTKAPLPKFITAGASKKELIVIGVSTGGPGCLQEVLQHLPANLPTPIVIAQHMPARFTQVFAQRLDKLCKLKVQEVTDAMQMKAGTVYLAQGDADVQVFKRGASLMVKPVPADKSILWHPNIGKLVDSAVQSVLPARLMCIQLTGMGNDGAKSMAAAHQKGAYCIAEAQETAVVYGMPKELVNLKGANAVLPNFKIAQAITELVK